MPGDVVGGFRGKKDNRPNYIVGGADSTQGSVVKHVIPELRGLFLVTCRHRISQDIGRTFVYEIYHRDLVAEAVDELGRNVKEVRCRRLCADYAFVASTPFATSAAMAPPTRCPGDSGPQTTR